MLQIKNFEAKPITLDRDLVNIFGINRALKLRTNVKRLRHPTSYFIHCDLIDKNRNYFNNKRSYLLAKLDVKSKASPQQPFCDCSTSSHVNSITLSNGDQDRELFDFKDKPLEFELEINKFSISTMSSVNVLPSAPQKDSRLYPLLPDFRMQKVNEISAALSKNVGHYRVVAKKYKRAKKVVNWSAADLVFFQLHFQARVLAPLFLLLCFLPQFHAATSVEHSLSLLQD